MDPSVVPIWKMLGGLWPLYVGIVLLLWFMGALGGLAGIVAHGIQAVMSFGMNFLARTVALGAALGLVLLAMVVFKAVGAPSIASFFPASATTAPAVPGVASPNPTPAVQQAATGP